MNTIEFGREKYHLQDEMYGWCLKNIGDGGWLKNDESIWQMESIFGNTTFTFKRPEDLTLFLLRWG